MKRSIVLYTLIFCLLFCSLTAEGVTLYIGDKDGFGFGAAAGLVGADGLPAQRVGDSTILDMGDVIPDKDKNGYVRADHGDDWDRRSSAERVDSKHDGARWTDVALVAQLLSGEGPGLANPASFVFRFTPPGIGDRGYGQDHILNIVYGDYDKPPMWAVVDGKKLNFVDLVTKKGDGYIWRSYATISWSDIKDGKLIVQVFAPNDPYLLIDYLLLDTNVLQSIRATPWLLLLKD
jgi:hypothetical protein